MRTIFLWTDISGYMAACWRELGAGGRGQGAGVREQGIQAKVLAYGSSQATEFSDKLMAGIDWTPMDESQRLDPDWIEQQILGFEADVIVLSGWLNKAYRQLPFRPALKEKRFIMTMDTPWWGQPKQYLAGFALRKYLNRINKVVVTGERSWQYAIRLGFRQNQIHRGLYGVDHRGFSECLATRIELDKWPKQFLYVGRYSEEKGLDVLLDAYRKYRELVDDPWPLVCCGKGKLDQLLVGVEGVDNRGFVQPDEVKAVMARSGAMILPSNFDPWPLVVVESCAAGLPVLCSEACGSSVELVRGDFSGWTFATGSSAALLEQMVNVSSLSSGELLEIGKNANFLSSAYSAELWATRWTRIVQDQ